MCIAFCLPWGTLVLGVDLVYGFPLTVIETGARVNAHITLNFDQCNLTGRCIVVLVQSTSVRTTAALDHQLDHVGG